MAKRNLKRYEVDAIRLRVRAEGVTDGQLAEILGCGRSHINQMLNHKVPMRTVYRYALVAVLMELRRNKAEQLP